MSRRITRAAAFSDLTIDKATGGYSLQVSSTGLPTITSNSFAVVAGAATQLVVTTPLPSSVTVGQAFGLTVTVEDAYFNPVTDDSGGVTVALRPTRTVPRSAAPRR